MKGIREGTAKMLEEDFAMDPQLTETLFDFGILDELTCRNKLIQRDFQRLMPRSKVTDLRLTLADKYCVSFSTIDKITSSTGK